MEKQNTSVRKISELMKNVDNFDVKQFKEILIQLSAKNDPTIITELLEILKDDFDYPEIMYSIIHVIEKFDNLTFCKYLLKSLPNFILNSPEWASIIFIRILNSESALDCFIEIFKKEADISQKEALKKLLLTINLEYEDFVEKTKPLLEIV